MDRSQLIEETVSLIGSILRAFDVPQGDEHSFAGNFPSPTNYLFNNSSHFRSGSSLPLQCGKCETQATQHPRLK